MLRKMRLSFPEWMRTQYVPIAGGATYDDMIDRDDAQPLMPEEVSNAFLKGLDSISAVLQTFTRLPVSRSQVRLPILASLPFAYWVNPRDTGLKQTTKLSWDNKYLDIEEIAVIVPVPDNVIDDADQPIWDRVRPLCEQAAGRLLDASVFFGSGPAGETAPATFPDDVVTGATSAGNVFATGTTAVDEGGIVGDQGELLTLAEAGGYDLSAGVASRAIKGLARKARNTLGDRLGEVAVGRDTVDIDGVTYRLNSMRGLWPDSGGTDPTDDALAILYDPGEFVVGVRSDIRWKLLDQAVITDAGGNIVFNLPQQDMQALRLTLRVGWQVANTIKYDQTVEADRYPAAILTH